MLPEAFTLRRRTIFRSHPSADLSSRLSGTRRNLQAQSYPTNPCPPHFSSRDSADKECAPRRYDRETSARGHDSNRETGRLSRGYPLAVPSVLCNVDSTDIHPASRSKLAAAVPRGPSGLCASFEWFVQKCQSSQ